MIGLKTFMTFCLPFSFELQTNTNYNLDQSFTTCLVLIRN